MTPQPGLASTESRCSKCRAPILWACTVNGKMQPLDATPNPEGNLRLLEEWVATPRGALQRVAVVKAGATLEFGDTGERYIAHFASCPFAEEFRKPKTNA